jgi:hypothetical protein
MRRIDVVAEFKDGNQVITAREGFEALRVFLRAFWERGGGVGFSNEVDWLLSAIEPTASGMPLDQAQWHDWIKAVNKVKARQ